MASESTVTLALRKQLNNHGWWVKISDRYVAGIPDLVGCCNGRFCSIEMKIGDNTPTALQRLNLAAIESRGGFAFVCTYDRGISAYRIVLCHSVFSRFFVGNAKEVAEWISKLCLSRISGNAGN